MLKQTALRFLSYAMLLCSAFAFKGSKDRTYFKPEFHLNAIVRTKPQFVSFSDMIPSDSLYACYGTEKFPRAYYREVFTNVCNGGECLPVWLFIYWSPGGAYLGYSLKDDNILTKERHVPFTEDDYLELHRLLATEESLLKDYVIKDLEPAPRDSLATPSRQMDFGNTGLRTTLLSEDFIDGWSSLDQAPGIVDGVSGATDKEVKLFVVKGALYTTYTLWHIVYGASRDSIRDLSLQYLSRPFLDYLLASGNVDDNHYALSVLEKFETQELMGVVPQLEKFLRSNNYALKEHAINALLSAPIPRDLSYKSLGTVFMKSDLSTKFMILDKLSDPDLPPDMVYSLVTNIEHENASMVQNIFNVLRKQKIIDASVRAKIATLLSADNLYIAKKAYAFLTPWRDNDSKLKSEIQNFEHRVKNGN